MKMSLHKNIFVQTLFPLRQTREGGTPPNPPSSARRDTRKSNEGSFEPMGCCEKGAEGVREDRLERKQAKTHQILPDNLQEGVELLPREVLQLQARQPLGGGSLGDDLSLAPVDVRGRLKSVPTPNDCSKACGSYH